MPSPFLSAPGELPCAMVAQRVYKSQPAHCIPSPAILCNQLELAKHLSVWAFVVMWAWCMCGDQSLELSAFIKRLGCRGGPWVCFGDICGWPNLFSVCISCDVIWTSRSRLLELLDRDCKFLLFVGWLGGWVQEFWRSAGTRCVAFECVG